MMRKPLLLPSLSVSLFAVTAGCGPHVPQHTVRVPTPRPPIQVGSYPKKADIPPLEKMPIPLTKADISYLRWLIQFDATVQQLQAEIKRTPVPTPERAGQFAQRWKNLDAAFAKRKAPPASLGVWPAYDGFLRENQLRYEQMRHLSVKADDFTYTDADWQKVLQHEKDAINYTMDLLDLRYPGKLPADIVAFRMK